VEFSPDDRYLLTSSKDGTVKLWDAQTKPQPNSWMLDQGEWPIGFTPDGRGLISIGADKTNVRHWQGAQVVKTLPCSKPFEQRLTAFSPRTQSLYAVRANGEVEVYDVNTLRVQRTFTLQDRCGTLYNLSPDERWLAGQRAGSGDLCVWDVASGKTVARFPEHLGGGGSYHLANFSPDSRLLAFATAKWEVKLWDTGTQQFMGSAGPHPWRVISITFSPDGRHLASSSWEGDVRLFETTTGHEIEALYGHGSGVHGHTFSSDGGTLVTAGDDNSVRFWHVATGREMLVFNNSSGEYARLPHLSPTGELAVWWDRTQNRARVESIPAMSEIEKARRAETVAR
jgi:WD40 repeat protein